MSIQNVPGFGPILNAGFNSLPQFLLSNFVRTAPFVIISLATLMSYNDFFRAIQERPSVLVGMNHPPDVYDFIIVGGGSSGAVVAYRLSKNYRVLLLEAGGDPHPMSYVPTLGPSLYNRPQVDWEYKSRPLNDSGRGSTYGSGIYYPRSRALGGDSNSNDMIYMRGNPMDYEAWAREAGDLRWSYQYVRKYFEKIEDYHGHWESVEDNGHGLGGPIHIEKAGFSQGVEHWLEAGSEFGLSSNEDPNGMQSEGLFQLDVMAKQGVRHGTYRGYLEKEARRRRFIRRRNGRNDGSLGSLTIHRYSVVTEIEFDNQDWNPLKKSARGRTRRTHPRQEGDQPRKATGVTYYRHAIRQRALADKEIILAAGAFNTPKLLLLAGIGPKEELESVGIEQMVELPVGKNNLQDHVSTIVGPFLLNSSESFLASRDLKAKTASDYITSGTGPFSVTNLIAGGGLISTLSSSPLHPNILLTMIGAGTDHVLQKQLVESFSLNKAKLSSYLNKYDNKDSNYVVVTLGKPRSRGTVRIGSFDPWHHPQISLNYFSDTAGQDIRDLVDGVKMAVSLYEKTKSFKKLDAKLAPEPYPGCESWDFQTDEYYECLIRTLTVTIKSPCCTAPMGIKGSPKAVVDAELKVIGVDGLRIVDASVMPEIPNAQLTAPTIMIGEVASDLIINEWTTKAKDPIVVKKSEG